MRDETDKASDSFGAIDEVGEESGRKGRGSKRDIRLLEHTHDKISQLGEII